MNPATDFDRLVGIIRAGVVPPDELARLARLWSPDRDPPFLDFLAASPVTASVGTADYHPPPPAGATASLDATPDPVGSTAPTGPAGEPPTADFCPGAKAALPLPAAPPGGRYLPLRLHRSGGLGSVYVARDTAVGRDVALKTIRPDRTAGPSQVARFVREAQLTGRLEHPCIVPVYDLPAAPPGGAPCYVMRFVVGRTLAEAAADYHRARATGSPDPLALAALLDAVVAVARAVGFAHSHHVLHRDLKGQNVVLGNHGEVFLLDWGLARVENEGDAASGSGSGSPGSTPRGSAVGTPGFMAPEVASGNPATRATDVYGLGGTLYQVLTGQPPHEGRTVKEIVHAAVETNPRPARDLNPAVPPALAAICHTALSRDPAARYASADEFATDLRRFLADEPVSAYREPWVGRAARWARRHRTGVAAAAVLLVTAAVGSATTAALVWREKERTATEWHRAEGEKRRAEANFSVAWSLTTDLGELVERTESGQGPKVSDATRRAWIERALAASQTFLAETPDDAEQQARAARLYRFSANLCRLLNDTAGADRAYREAVRLQAALADRFPDDPAYRVRLVDTLRDQAALLRRLGKLSEAAGVLDRCVESAAGLRAATPHTPDFARAEALARIDRAEVESRRGRYAEAESDATRAAKLLAELPARSHPLDPVFRVMAAQQTAKAGRGRTGPDALTTAMSAHDEAVRLGRENPDRGADAQHLLFHALVERARTALRIPARREEAVGDAGAAARGWEDLLKQYPGTPMYREGMATALMIRGRLRAAAGEKTAAAPDLVAAIPVVEELVRANPELPGYRGLLGDVWVGRAEVAATPAELDASVDRALSSYRAARNREGENPAHSRAIGDVESRWPEAAARSAARRKEKDTKP